MKLFFQRAGAAVRRFFEKKLQMNLLWLILVYLGLGAVIFCVTVWLQPGSFLATLKNFLKDPRLLALNLFPILAVLGLTYLAFGNIFFAGSVTSLLFHLLSLVNLIKVECRKDPLVPPDFALLGEAVAATGEYRLNLHIPLVILILLFAAVLFVLGFKLKRKPKLLPRLIAAVLILALAVGSMLTVYPSPTLYRDVIGRIPGLSYTNVPLVFDQTGYVYCFLHNVGMYEVQKPEGYSRAEAKEWASQTAEPVPGGPLPVNVIFVQCEAFSDLFDDDAFAYTEEENPLHLYHEVIAGDRALSGHIVVSNFGAGTANTEFDVLTGMQTNMLNETQVSALRVIHKNVSSLARTFTGLGYDNWFLHPGERWFYNRESVYHYFGMHDQTFKDGFRNRSWKGGWISDKSFGLELEQKFEEHRAASGKPWFAFTVTAQNHQSYPWTKYDFTVEKARLKVPVSDAAMEQLSVYAEGIRDSSALLMELTRYFDGVGEPTLVIFWGDHLPAMGANFGAYREIGTRIGDETNLASAIDTYTTPFVIWANRAYDEKYGFGARVQALDMPAAGRISDIYLGELVYELLDMSGTDAYFDYLGVARRILPVINLGRYELPDGTLTEELNEEQQAVEVKLRRWTYYRVIDERVSD